MQRVRRIAAYGVCRDDDGRVLLARASARSLHCGWWFLPGGGVEHGEHPADAVVREIAEETGLDVVVERVRDVVTDVDEVAGGLRHQDRIIFDTRVVGGRLTDEVSGSTDQAAWVEPSAQPRLVPFVRRVLGLPYERAELAALPPADPPPRAPARLQRFAAYGLVTGLGDQVLLTRIAAGYPGAGLWHLPGGGTDFGEDAADALRREVVEETNQHIAVEGLLEVSHWRDAAALGPEGVPIDFHGVRVVFRARVGEPSVPRVNELEGAGSTAEAAWFAAGAALDLPLTDVARPAVAAYLVDSRQ